jgi:hypothetical protein
MAAVSRLLWFAAGAASGAYALVKARRTAQNFTPEGIGARASALGVGVRLFADELTAAMAVREAELRAELRLPGGAPRALDGTLRDSTGDPDRHAATDRHGATDRHPTAGLVAHGDGHPTNDQDEKSRHDGHR